MSTLKVDEKVAKLNDEKMKLLVELDANQREQKRVVESANVVLKNLQQAHDMLLTRSIEIQGSLKDLKELYPDLFAEIEKKAELAKTEDVLQPKEEPAAS